MKKTSKTRVIVALIGVAIVIATLLAYGFMANRTTKDNSANTQKIDDVKNNAPTPTESGLPTNPSSQPSNNIPVNYSGAVKIVSTSQQNGRVEAIASVSGPGTCVFQYVTDNDKPVISEVMATDQQCKSSINEVQFTKLGIWKLTVVYYSDSKKNETSVDVLVN